VRVIATSPPGGSVICSRASRRRVRQSVRPAVHRREPARREQIGAEVVLRAPPDGQLLFVAPPGPFSINAQLLPSTAFNPRSDIAPVALLGVAPLLLVAHPRCPPAISRNSSPG